MPHHDSDLNLPEWNFLSSRSQFSSPELTLKQKLGSTIGMRAAGGRLGCRAQRDKLSHNAATPQSPAAPLGGGPWNQESLSDTGGQAFILCIPLDAPGKKYSLEDSIVTQWVKPWLATLASQIRTLV